MLRMNSTRQPSTSKVPVWFVAACVSFGYLLLLVGLVAMVAAIVGIMFFRMPRILQVSARTVHLLLGVFALFLVSFVLLAVAYLLVALQVRCPHCGFQFLKNPESLGPNGFVYHPTCPWFPSKNRWFCLSPGTYQIGRFLRTGRIRCIKCGEEVFPDRHPAA